MEASSKSSSDLKADKDTRASLLVAKKCPSDPLPLFLQELPKIPCGSIGDERVLRALRLGEGTLRIFSALSTAPPVWAGTFPEGASRALLSAPSVAIFLRLRFSDAGEKSQRFLGPKSALPPQRALRFVLATKKRKRLRFFLRFFEEKDVPIAVWWGRCLPASSRRPWKPLLRVSASGRVSASLRIVFAIVTDSVWYCVMVLSCLQVVPFVV